MGLYSVRTSLFTSARVGRLFLHLLLCRRLLTTPPPPHSYPIHQPTGSDDAAKSGNDSDEISGSEDAGVEEDLEFENEEQLATVTVVEDFDPASLIYGPPGASSTSEMDPHDPSGADNDSQPTPAARSSASLPKRKVTKRDDGISKKKTSGKREKSKKIKYETKAARKTARSKQIARRTEKAERAGGKASRKGKRR